MTVVGVSLRVNLFVWLWTWRTLPASFPSTASRSAEETFRLQSPAPQCGGDVVVRAPSRVPLREMRLRVDRRQKPLPRGSGRGRVRPWPPDRSRDIRDLDLGN